MHQAHLREGQKRFDIKDIVLVLHHSPEGSGMRYTQCDCREAVSAFFRHCLRIPHGIHNIQLSLLHIFTIVLETANVTLIEMNQTVTL